MTHPVKKKKKCFGVVEGYDTSFTEIPERVSDVI